MNYSIGFTHSAQGIGTDHALCGRDAGNEQIERVSLLMPMMWMMMMAVVLMMMMMVVVLLI